MEWTDVDLRELLACCRRELAFRERCYPRWVSKGTLTDKKAALELELMRLCVDYFVDAVFRAVTAGNKAKISSEKSASSQQIG